MLKHSRRVTFKEVILAAPVYVGNCRSMPYPCNVCLGGDAARGAGATGADSSDSDEAIMVGIGPPGSPGPGRGPPFYFIPQQMDHLKWRQRYNEPVPDFGIINTDSSSSDLD